MKILITGANGFIGKNLQLHLAERKDVEVVCFTRSHDVAQLPQLLQGVDFVFHLAGVNRPQDPLEFTTGNADLTQALCGAICDVAAATGKKVPIDSRNTLMTERVGTGPAATSPRLWKPYPAGRTTSPTLALTRWSSCCGPTRF